MKSQLFDDLVIVFMDQKIIDITIAKGSFTVFDHVIFDNFKNGYSVIWKYGIILVARIWYEALFIRILV